MATMDVTTELRLTELRKRNLRKTFDHIEAQSSSVLFLSLQWKDIEEHFDSITKSISQRHKEVTTLEESIIKRFDEIQSREQGVESVQESVNQRFKELELREKSFEKKERFVFEEQSKELNLLRVSVENQSREVQIVQRVVEEEVKALELKEERLVILQKSVEEESKNSIKRSFRDLEFKERQLCLIEKSVELKGRVIETCSKELELNGKRLEERAKEVELKEEKFEEHEKAFALKEKRLEEHEKAFSLKDKRLEERAVEIELKGKRLEERAKEVELKEERFEEHEKAFALKEKRLEERAVEIELEGKRFEEGAKEVELKEKRFEGRLKAFDLKEKELEERVVEIDLEGKRFEEVAKEVELKEKRFERRSKAFYWKEKRLEERSVEIELKGKRFEERAKEMELKEKRFEEHEKAFALKEKRLEERSVEIELKGKRFEDRAKEVELKEMRFEEHYIEIDLKEKKLEERYREVELKGKTLEQCSKEVELKEKESEEWSLDIEAKGQGFTEDFYSEVQSEEFETLVGSNAIVVDAPKHVRLCEIIDGNSLQMFLNKHCEEHDLMRDEVLYALSEASDPAKLVLDAMQGFYPLNADNGDTSIELDVVRKSCILLLEQLMRLSPEITPIVKGEATTLAFDWMTKMNPKAENHMEFLGFLLLLAAFGLAAAFDEDELVSQLVVVARDRQAPELCRLLGLAPDKISDIILILILIARNQHLDAIRFIYAFKLVGDFQPVRLLKQYMKLSEEAARKICRMQNYSPAAQIEAFNKRVADLKAVIRCIEDHNLESEVPLKDLECSITELEKKKANIIKTFPSSVPKPQPQQHCEKTCIIVAPPVPLQTIAPTFEPTPNVQEGQECGNKRIRTALSVTDAFNASLGATSSIYSVPFPNLKPSSTRTDQEIKQTTLVKPQKNNTKKQSWNLPLKPHSREAAMKLAANLKVKLDEKIERRDDVMNFLNHLATYELASSFDPDELLGLFEYVYRRKSAPDVCRDLGLADKIPKFIQNLIEKEEWIGAIRYVYAFGLHDRFPPVTLLKDYLSHSKKVADKKLKDGKNSLEARFCSIQKERSASRCVLFNIANFKLESEYPPKILKDRIVQLKKQSEDILIVLNSTGRGGPVTRSNTEKKYTASTTVTPIPAAQPLQQSGRKRRRARLRVQDSTGHYFSAGFPSITRRTGPYPFSYHPEPGYYHGEPAAPCGGPCHALNGPCGCRGPSYRDEQAHCGSNDLPPRCHSSLYP